MNTNSKFKKAVAVRTILKSKSELGIDDEKISLMMGKHCHVVIYPINKKKELNFVCILRHGKKDPIDIKIIRDKVVKQNSNLAKVYNRKKNLVFIDFA